ncbi:MAG: hypothetical protein AAF621_03175 [Pseudomonadota bacterium]
MSTVLQIPNSESKLSDLRLTKSGELLRFYHGNSRKLRKIPLKDFRRYGAPDHFFFTLKFTPEGLNDLRRKYRDVKGVPRFIRDFLNDCPSEHKASMFKMPGQQEIIKTSDGTHFLLLPNPSYTPFEERLKHPRTLKNTDIGVNLCAWFIHPDYIKNSEVGQALTVPELRKRYQKKLQKIYDNNSRALDCNKSGDNHCSKRENIQDVFSDEELRHPSQKKIKDIERESGIRYLTSLPDLKPSDAPMLRELKHKILEYMKREYDINEKGDNLRIYVHFPYTLKNTTFHLQIKTAASHPLEDDRSFDIDKIIKHFEINQNNENAIDDLILSHKGENPNVKNKGEFLLTSGNKFYKGIRGATYTPSHNPSYHYTKK